MNYVSAMMSVLRLDETIYPAIMAEGKTTRYCMLSVLIFGILYALSALYFSGTMMADTEPAAGSLPLVDTIVFILIGVAVAFFLHAGGAMFLWVFTRGIGGNTAFFPVYFNLGISLVGLWPLAPVLTAFQAGYKGSGVLFLLGIFSIYGLAVIIFSAKSASGLSLAKMITAMCVTIVVVGSLLYLWV